MFQQIIKLAGACFTVVGGILSTYGISTHSMPMQIAGACVAGAGGAMSAFSPQIGGAK